MSVKIKISLLVMTILCGLIIVLALYQKAPDSGKNNLSVNNKVPETLTSHIQNSPARLKKIALRKKLQEIEDARMTPAEVKNALAENCSAETKIELIGNLSGNHSDAALKILNNLLDDESMKVRLEAIEMIAEFSDEKILPSVEKALNDANEKVRLAAVNAVDELQAGALIAKAVDDQSENVRDAALDMVEDSSNEIKLDLCQYGIHSPYRDVQKKTVSMLSDITSKRTVEILIDGLRINNKELQREIQEELEYCIDKEFKNYQQAAAWWKKNKKNYTDDLNKINKE